MVVNTVHRYFLCSLFVWIPTLAFQLVATANDDITTQKKIVWLDNYSRALVEARAAGKPILIAFRCVP